MPQLLLLALLVPFWLPQLLLLLSKLFPSDLLFRGMFRLLLLLLFLHRSC
jgi:hypothetical protein